MKNRLFPALLLVPSLATQAIERPNVIVINADDLGFGDLECYNGKESTPHINEFAKQGCLFTDAYSAASTSTPSRFALLTGQYAWRGANSGIATGDAAMLIGADTYTVADVFSQAGYTTAAFGKWHLGLGSTTGAQDWNGELDLGLSDIGFDEWHIMAATGDRVPCVYIAGHTEKGGKYLNRGKVVNLDPSDPIRVSYDAALGDSTYADFPQAVKLHPRSATDHHAGTIVDSISRIGHMTGGYAARWKDENIADTIVAQTLQFIRRQAKASNPFFIYMATNDVHVPRWPHARFRGKSKTGLRGDAILQFDWCVGQVMQTLQELGIDQNTWVIITSDNGPVLNDGYQDQAVPLTQEAGHVIAGGLRGGKYTAFEGGTRVPFLVRWPGVVKSGSRSAALVSQVDLLRVMATLVKQEIPHGQAIDSESQLPSWLGKEGEGRDYVVQSTNQGKLSLRTRNWKLLHSGELYAMDETTEQGPYTSINTPNEKINQAKNHPDTLAVLRQLLQKEKQKK